jgi:hypothetical protein
MVKTRKVRIRTARGNEETVLESQEARPDSLSFALLCFAEGVGGWDRVSLLNSTILLPQLLGAGITGCSMALGSYICIFIKPELRGVFNSCFLKNWGAIHIS